MDLQLVSEGLRDAVIAADIGLNCYEYLPDQVEVPAFYVGEIGGKYDQTYGGMQDLQVTCRVLVSKTDDKDGQALLKAYLAASGPKSVKAAIEGTPGVGQELGGACDDVHVPGFQRYGIFQHQADSFYGAEWVVRVIG